MCTGWYGSLHSIEPPPPLLSLKSVLPGSILMMIYSDQPDDLRIDIFKSSAGGQNVQKNATAVRLTHIDRYRGHLPERTLADAES